MERFMVENNSIVKTELLHLDTPVITQLDTWVINMVFDISKIK